MNYPLDQHGSPETQPSTSGREAFGDRTNKQGEPHAVLFSMCKGKADCVVHSSDTGPNYKKGGIAEQSWHNAQLQGLSPSRHFGWDRCTADNTLVH